MERRRFIESLAMGMAAFGADRPVLSAEDAGFKALRDDVAANGDPAAAWARVRREFLLNPGMVHLNTGSLGATPRRVLEAVAGCMYELEGDPVSNVFGPMGHRMEGVRSKAAEFLGARLDEVVLTENTTSGMNAVAQGLSGLLKPGDEILTTNHEHPGGSVCWDY